MKVHSKNMLLARFQKKVTAINRAISRQPLIKLSVFREKYYRKRHHFRKLLNAHAQVTSSHGTEDCHIIDFSQDGGAKLQMSERQNRLGHTLNLRILDSNDTGTDYLGEVVWQDKFSLGLQFSSPTH